MTSSARHRARPVRGRALVDGEAVAGYRADAEQSDSATETFVALKAEIDNWRWAGVPFYLRTGKRMPKRCSEIVVQFKTGSSADVSGQRRLIGAEPPGHLAATG